MEKKCEPYILARRGVFRITRCADCGCISLDVGALSLRIDDDSLFRMRDALIEGTNRLTAIQSGSAWSAGPSELQ